MDGNKKLWGGRFAGTTDAAVEAFTASIGFDRRLAEDDLAGSLAHAAMLARQGILGEAEAAAIRQGLLSLQEDLHQGRLTFSSRDEDIHMNLERLLLERVGPVGGMLHTARSRNDQVALDLHLYLRRETRHVMQGLGQVMAALVARAEQTQDVIIPGYTHLQRAQPVLMAHHWLAYFWMFARDLERLRDSLVRLDRMPLGAGALAGTSLPIDPWQVAKELGFSALYDNSLDAVADRDFVVEFEADAALVMVHASRLCEELVLWSSREFQLVELDDAYTTGSSMMPQKKNPDVAELIRGKSGRVAGHLTALLMTLKGLPLAYNRDLQEDKEGLFDTVDTLRAALPLLAGMVGTLTVRRERARAMTADDDSAATDLADYLVRRGMPFRDAHMVVGRLVLSLSREGTALANVTAERLRQESELFGPDALEIIRPEQRVAARRTYSGTAPDSVASQLRRARSHLDTAESLLLC
ncbi:MAG: argininosuccinate lyase [Bacillota bacterium]